MPSKRKRRPEIRCTHGSKVRFRSQAKARQAIQEHRNSPSPLFVYECPNCGGWHITRMPQPRQKGAAS